MCDSKVDETTCVNDCKNLGASYIGKVRNDFVSLLNSCYATASCDKLKDCSDTAKASVAPTATVQLFCDEYVKKNTECKVGTTDKAKCLNDFKIFSDSGVETARTTCLQKPCPDHFACAASSLGIKL